MSAGPSRALALLNLLAQAAHFARHNLAPPLRDMKRFPNRAIIIRFFSGQHLQETVDSGLYLPGSIVAVIDAIAVQGQERQPLFM